MCDVERPFYALTLRLALALVCASLALKTVLYTCIHFLYALVRCFGLQVKVRPFDNCALRRAPTRSSATILGLTGAVSCLARPGARPNNSFLLVAGRADGYPLFYDGSTGRCLRSLSLPLEWLPSCSPGLQKKRVRRSRQTSRQPPKTPRGRRRRPGESS